MKVGFVKPDRLELASRILPRPVQVTAGHGQFITSAGSPAEHAGLMPGDVLMKVGDVEITDIHAFVYALQIYKPGDVVLTRFLRDGEEQSVRVTLATRDGE